MVHARELLGHPVRTGHSPSFTLPPVTIWLGETQPSTSSPTAKAAKAMAEMEANRAQAQADAAVTKAFKEKVSPKMLKTLHALLPELITSLREAHEVEEPGIVPPWLFRTALLLLGNMNKQHRLSRDQAQLLFEALDYDADGRLSLDEVEAALKYLDGTTSSRQTFQSTSSADASPRLALATPLGRPVRTGHSPPLTSPPAMAPAQHLKQFNEALKYLNDGPNTSLAPETMGQSRQAARDDKKLYAFGALLQRHPLLVKCARAIVVTGLYFTWAIFFYRQKEEGGWTPLEAIYFAAVTMSTVGYGDYSPSQDTIGGMPVTVLFIFIGFIFVFAEISGLVTMLVTPIFVGVRDLLERLFPPQSIDLDGDGGSDFKVPRRPVIYYGSNLIAPVFVIVGGQFFWAWAYDKCEGWGYGVAFYHCMTTATTVGYGDVRINVQRHAPNPGLLCSRTCGVCRCRYDMVTLTRSCACTIAPLRIPSAPTPTDRQWEGSCNLPHPHLGIVARLADLRDLFSAVQACRHSEARRDAQTTPRSGSHHVPR